MMENHGNFSPASSSLEIESPRISSKGTLPQISPNNKQDSPNNSGGQERFGSDAVSSSSLLSRRTPDPVAFNGNKVVKAIQNGDLSQLRELLKDLPNLRGKGGLKIRGSTALHEAAKGGHSEIVQELLSRGAEANVVNRSGCCPLHFAALCKHPERASEVGKLLIDAMANLNCTNERQDTPLHFAAYRKGENSAAELCRLLLEARAAINARNKNSDTPLINAALNANSEAASLLCDRKADIDHRNFVSKTAIDLAQEHNNIDVLTVIENSQATKHSGLTHLADEMRTALQRLQAVDVLSRDLKRQTSMCEAYEGAMWWAMSELESAALGRLASRAMSVFRSTSSSSSRDLEALIVLLSVAQAPEGQDLLGEMGVQEIIPSIESRSTVKEPPGSIIFDQLKVHIVQPRGELLASNANFADKGCMEFCESPRPTQTTPSCDSPRPLSSASTFPSSRSQCADLPSSPQFDAMSDSNCNVRRKSVPDNLADVRFQKPGRSLRLQQDAKSAPCVVVRPPPGATSIHRSWTPTPLTDPSSQEPSQQSLNLAGDVLPHYQPLKGNGLATASSGSRGKAIDKKRSSGSGTNDSASMAVEFQWDSKGFHMSERMQSAPPMCTEQVHSVSDLAREDETDTNLSNRNRERSATEPEAPSRSTVEVVPEPPANPPPPLIQPYLDANRRSSRSASCDIM